VGGSEKLVDSIGGEKALAYLRKKGLGFGEGGEGGEGSGERKRPFKIGGG